MTFTEVYYDLRNVQHQRAVYMVTDKKTADMFNLTYAGDRIVNFDAIDDWGSVNSCIICRLDNTEDKYRVIQVNGYSCERGMYIDVL